MDPNEMKDLRELIEFLKANDIAEFDLEKDGLKVRLAFVGAKQAAAPVSAGFDLAQVARMLALAPAAAAGASAQVAHVHGAAEAAPASAAAIVPVPEAAKHHVVKSPIVGTFYESPSPGSPAFVKVGDTVEVGQILCIVEAMKLMNEIESDAAGVVMERIASSGQPVEYGQALFSIKAS